MNLRFGWKHTFLAKNMLNVLNVCDDEGEGVEKIVKQAHDWGAHDFLCFVHHLSYSYPKWDTWQNTLHSLSITGRLQEVHELAKGICHLSTFRSSLSICLGNSLKFRYFLDVCCKFLRRVLQIVDGILPITKRNTLNDRK